MMIRSTFLGCALGFLVARAALLTSTGFDWDELMMLAMGFAGFAYVVVDLKRTSRLDDLAGSFGERLAKLEASDLSAVEGRLRTIEIRAEFEQRVDERLASVAERVAVLETHREHDLKRVSALEDGGGE